MSQTTYEYSFTVTLAAFPDDWRDTSKDQKMFAVWELFQNMERVVMDLTEAEFTEFRASLLEGGYELEEIFRLELPLPKPKRVR